jgi:polar amino acid transport system substrate-binding protein
MLLLGLLLSSLAWAQMPAALLVNDRLQILLQQQRSLGCDVIQNTLQSVLCTGQLKIGVRSTYKGFGAQIGDELVGYEIDFAHFIAKQLGVKPIFVPVDVFTRTQKLVEGETDLSLATITHTKEREETVHFILPHYYTSPTSVAGLKSRNIKGLDDLKGVSLCAPSGAYSNVTFQETRARMLLFDNPQKMFNALRFGACDLVTQDQALILAELTGSKAPQMMRDRFEEKFTFGEAPWGMAIRLGDREVTLGKAVALISAEALVTGLLEKFAIQHGVMVPFISDQRMIWSHTSCYLLGGELSPTCLIDAPSHADTSSILAPLAKGLERWVKNSFDIDLTLPMLSGKEGLRVLVRGSVISLLLAIGVIVATVFFGLTFYFFSKSRWSVLRVTSHIIRLIIMNSPMILLLVLFYLVMSGVWVYTEVISVLTAVLAIGLNNGAMAGDSLVQSSKTFAMGSSLSNIARVSATPFRASVINATKASPIAAFIGAPELLSVLIDLTAFSGGRAVTLGIMTLFYLLVVQLVVVLSARVVNKLNMSAPGDSHA